MANAMLPWRLAHGGEDPTYYPPSDDMGTNTLELILRELLRPLLARWLAQQGRRIFVGADQFVYYRQFDATRRVAPDLYAHPGFPPDAAPASILTWKHGPPVFALEVVSKDKRKDYIESPIRYEQVGVRELILYDPEWASRVDGRRFQVFATERGKGFVRVDETNEDWIPSSELGCCFREVEGPGYPLLRLATGPTGRTLFPTETEALTQRADALTRQVNLAAREAITDLCEVLGIELTPERRARLDAMEAEELAALRARIKSERSWAV
jgi:Uma2 family endonuclease